MAERYTDTRMDLRIDYTANHPGGKMDGVHYHDAYEIYLLEQGERNYLIDGTLVSLSEHEVALIKPFELHSTDGSAYSRYVLYFKEEYLDRYFSAEGKAALLSLFTQKKLTLTEGDYARVTALLTELNGRREDFLLLAEILRLLLASRELPSRESEEGGTLTARVTKYLGEHYLDFQGLDELAARFFVTKSHLCRLFKRETGLSIVTYVHAQKLSRATDELRFTRKPIRRIAADCGFGSSVYFCKLFRSTLGTSPGDYRKKHQI
jgi:AraC-like DNA-binding protein